MFKIEISTGGAAFGDGDKYQRNDEIRRILGAVEGDLHIGKTEGKCVDWNGNVVGEWKVE